MAKRSRPTAHMRRLKNVRAALDDRYFYDVAQIYRHANAIHPAEVVEAFEALKDAIIEIVKASR